VAAVAHAVAGDRGGGAAALLGREGRLIEAAQGEGGEVAPPSITVAAAPPEGGEPRG